MAIQRVEKDHHCSELDILRRLPRVRHEFDSVVIPVLTVWEEGNVLYELQVGFGQANNTFKFVISHAERDVAEVLVV